MGRDMTCQRGLGIWAVSEGLVIEELNNDECAIPRKMPRLGLRQIGLLLVSLHRGLGILSLKKRQCYLPVVEGGRQQITLSLRAVGLRPPCHLAYRAQRPHSRFMFLLGIIPIGMFSPSSESQ